MFTPCLFGQTTAFLSGTVIDPSGAVIAGAKVRLSHAINRFASETTSAEDGAFRFSNIPFQTYRLEVRAQGFEPFVQPAELRSNIPVQVTVRMRLDSVQEATDVSVTDRVPLVDPQQTSTYAQINRADIERLPGPGRGLESVLATLPGFAQNANGAIHPRGAHNQMTYVVDGMPISDQLTGAFANAIDPNVVQTVELFTGNIPAEYGNKLSAVANVTTRSGLGSGRKFAGGVETGAGQFGTLSQLAHATGQRRSFGYSASVNLFKSNRYLDAVSRDNLHNGGNSERGFARFDWQASARDSLRWTLLAGNAGFQLANLRSQHANGMDQRQRLRDFAALMGWVRALDSRTTIDSTASIRAASSWLLPSAGDTPVTAWQSRRSAMYNFAASINHVRGRHQIRAGGAWQRFPVRERFQFAITDAGFNDPADPNFIETLVAHDLTRGGAPFQFAARAAGSLGSAHFQDNVRLGRLHLTLGLREDRYAFLVRGWQLQPRVGAALHLKETGTVLRASYNRTFQPPPNENLLMASSNESSTLVAPGVRATLGGALALIQPERQNFYEVGLQQSLGRAALQAAFYHKDGRDQQDNNNFFNTGIIFPMALARIRVNAVEARFVAPAWRGFTGTLSATHGRAVSTPPFTGGLFIGNSAVDALSQGAFVIDHDQKLSMHGVLGWARHGWFATASVRHDSGLVVNPSDPAAVAADSDYSDLLPYVNLGSKPPRTRPRTITDVLVGYERWSDERRKWEASVQAANLFDRTALYNFQSLFVGTRLVTPRSVSVRLRLFF